MNETLLLRDIEHKNIKRKRTREKEHVIGINYAMKFLKERK